MFLVVSRSDVPFGFEHHILRALSARPKNRAPRKILLIEVTCTLPELQILSFYGANEILYLTGLSL